MQLGEVLTVSDFWDRAMALLRRMPPQPEWVEAIALLTAFFDGDELKARRWMEARNPLLGYMRPASLMALGRGNKVVKLIKTQLAENAAP